MNKKKRKRKNYGRSIGEKNVEIEKIKIVTDTVATSRYTVVNSGLEVICSFSDRRRSEFSLSISSSTFINFWNVIYAHSLPFFHVQLSIIDFVVVVAAVYHANKHTSLFPLMRLANSMTFRITFSSSLATSIVCSVSCSTFSVSAIIDLLIETFMFHRWPHKPQTFSDLNIIQRYFDDQFESITVQEICWLCAGKSLVFCIYLYVHCMCSSYINLGFFIGFFRRTLVSTSWSLSVNTHRCRFSSPRHRICTMS